MAGYDASRWSEFALAQLGASAAVLGLVFVALSINLRAIIGSQVLVNRATETVIVLANVLVTATLVLIPAQDRGVVSAELSVAALATFAIVWRLQRGALAANAGDDRGFFTAGASRSRALASAAIPTGRDL